MKKLVAVLALSALVSLPVFAALKVGDKAPSFSAKASLAGKEFNFSLEDALKKGPVVVYFYPLLRLYQGLRSSEAPHICGDEG